MVRGSRVRLGRGYGETDDALTKSGGGTYESASEEKGPSPQDRRDIRRADIDEKGCRPNVMPTLNPSEAKTLRCDGDTRLRRGWFAEARKDAWSVGKKR